MHSHDLCRNGDTCAISAAEPRSQEGMLQSCQQRALQPSSRVGSWRTVEFSARRMAARVLSLSNLTAVEASPHLWMINICRNSCGFCQSLAPRWERLARTLGNEAHVAYWDAEQSFALPARLSAPHVTIDIQGVVRIEPTAEASTQGAVEYRYTLDGTPPTEDST